MYRYCKGLQRIEKVKVDTINWTDIWKVLKEISEESELLDEFTFIDLKDFLSWFNKNKFDLQTFDIYRQGPATRRVKSASSR